MTGRGINTVRIGDEVKHITELDALTLMHEWALLMEWSPPISCATVGR